MSQEHKKEKKTVRHESPLTSNTPLPTPTPTTKEQEKKKWVGVASFVLPTLLMLWLPPLLPAWLAILTWLAGIGLVSLILSKV